MRIPDSFTARKFAFAFLAVFVFAAASLVHAQTPTPSPDKDEVIRVNTNLIQTNVTVFDKENRFVENLKPEQFKLSVDGKPVKIEFFESVAPVKPVAGERVTENRAAAVTKTNFASRGRKVVFFIDDLHLSLDSLGRTRSTIRHFIENNMLPLDNVLIVTASGQLGFLQQFTDHPRVLEVAIDRLRQIPNTVRDTDFPPMPEYTAIRIYNGDKTAAQYYVDELVKSMKTKEVSVNVNALFETVKQRAGNIVSGLTAGSENTLGSLENLMSVLGQNNERKIIFFISDGFYLETKSGNFIDSSRLQRVVNQATRSGSTFYTIDARGLFSLSPDATGDRPIDPKGNLDRARIGEETASQEGLFVLANETGGRFLKNQNYFEKWVDRMMDENAGYYLLAWLPEKEEQSSRNFRRIEVSVVGRSDLSVRMQRGYLANPEKIAGNKNSTKNPPPPIVAPNASNDSTPKKVLPVTLSLNYLDVPEKGGVLTSSVQIATDSLNYGEGGKQTAAVDLVGLIYDDRGKQIADFKTGLSVTPPSAGATEQSVIYNHRTPLAAGIYLVKVAAREAKSGQIGITTQWIEIPDLSKRQLTLGSILLGAKTVKSNDAAQQQVQFSVDHRFPRPFNLNFMSFIYNAARAETGAPNLSTQIEVFDLKGRAIISTPTSPLVLKGNNDLARIPLTGAIRQDLIAPGTYLLRITVNDLMAKTTAVQQTVFTIE